MKLLLKAMTGCAVALATLVSCSKEEPTYPSQIIENGTVHAGHVNTPAVIDGKTYVYNHPAKKEKLKGVYADHLNGAPWLRVTPGIAKVDGSNKTYQTMKVVLSDKPGDYFYIMCKNLDIPGSDNDNYLAYDFSSENAEKYGLLYDWNEANNLGLKVFMDLPMVYDNVEYPEYTSRCFGHLPSRDDIEALLGVSSVGHLPSNGTSPSASSESKYYDAFVGGLGAENEAYDLTLVGYANNMDYPPQRFFGMQKHTKLWTSEESSSNGAYPLSIAREENNGTILNYVAYINVGHAKRYAMVVRYVFKPAIN